VCSEGGSIVEPLSHGVGFQRLCLLLLLLLLEVRRRSLAACMSV
jgi:hypothetical protein